jgi:hypothetical protein
MARRVFISYQHEDQMKAKGFNLLRWNKNVDVQFVGRHLLDPVNSNNRDYIRSKVKEQLSGTSVTVVLIGEKTSESGWVADEVRWSLEKGNGVLGIRLDSAGETPQALSDCGAEVIDWDAHEFADAIERAFVAAKRTRAVAAAGGGGGSGCGR